MSSASTPCCTCHIVTQHNFGFRLHVRLCKWCSDKEGLPPPSEEGNYNGVKLQHKSSKIR